MDQWSAVNVVLSLQFSSALQASEEVLHYTSGNYTLEKEIIFQTENLNQPPPTVTCKIRIHQ